MSSISIEERKSLESKIKLFIHSIGAPENATSSLVNLFEPLLSGLNAKVEYSEIREILLRMDKGFEAMDKRFEAIDKRFEDMQKYMDKRFEAIDKRFEDMNKRFEDMQKYMDKRFVMLLSFVSLAFLAMPAIITLILKFMQ